MLLQLAGTWNRRKGWNGSHLRSGIHFEHQRNGGRREEIFTILCQATFRSSVVGIADDWQVFQLSSEKRLIETFFFFLFQARLN